MLIFKGETPVSAFSSRSHRESLLHCTLDVLGPLKNPPNLCMYSIHPTIWHLFPDVPKPIGPTKTSTTTTKKTNHTQTTNHTLLRHLRSTVSRVPPHIPSLCLLERSSPSKPTGPEGRSRAPAGPHRLPTKQRPGHRGPSTDASAALRKAQKRWVCVCVCVFLWGEGQGGEGIIRIMRLWSVKCVCVCSVFFWGGEGGSVVHAPKTASALWRGWNVVP